MTIRPARSPFPRAAAVALLALAAPIAAQQRSVDAVLLVRCGPCDIVLNKPLLDALLAEGSLHRRLHDEFGEDYGGQGVFEADLPAPHLAGTFQVHIHGDPYVGGEWHDGRKQRIVELVVEHLSKRLDHLCYEEPRARLEQLREEQRQRHKERQLHAFELRHRLERTAQRADHSRGRNDQLAQELEDARIARLTDEHAKLFLADQQAETQKRLDMLTQELLHAEIDRQTLAAQLDDAKAQVLLPSGQPGEYERAQAVLRDLQNKLTLVEAQLDQRRQVVAQVRQELTTVLEALPQAEIAAHRSQARLDSLERSFARQSAEQEGLAEQQKDDAMLRIEVEQLEIDAQVARQQLVEIEGQLARLRPVRYQLLRTR